MAGVVDLSPHCQGTSPPSVVFSASLRAKVFSQLISCITFVEVGRAFHLLRSFLHQAHFRRVFMAAVAQSGAREALSAYPSSPVSATCGDTSSLAHGDSPSSMRSPRCEAFVMTGDKILNLDHHVSPSYAKVSDCAAFILRVVPAHRDVYEMVIDCGYH